MPLKEVYKLDLRIAKRLIKYNDFWEGIKKVVYNKDYIPNWTHESALDVTNDELEAIFKKLGKEELDI